MRSKTRGLTFVKPVTRPLEAESPTSQPLLEPLFHLILLDDNDHTYEYVIDLLGHVFGYQRGKAFALACAVDSHGQAIVETAGHEQVTSHQRRIHSYGADHRITRCRGSMSAIIEQAP